VFSSLPYAEYFDCIDKTQMVAAGHNVYVGWLDLSAENAQLTLACYDLSAGVITPNVKSFLLSFKSAEYKDSFLTDLIAVDGVLYALLTQSKSLTPREITWERQIVIALK
jgi:hypothetical protein